MDVWKVGMELVKEIYKLTYKLPPHELYGLTAQLRRASASILTNLAEGYSRSSSPDKAHKYTISRGEYSEVRAYLLICMELGYFKREELVRAVTLSEQEGQILSGLIRAYSPSEPEP
jgi:four helix bundle protein